VWICDCASVAPARGALHCGSSFDDSEAFWGHRIKTDRRDALKLARLLRAGELKAIYIPEPTDEAIRDLCRARTDAVDDLRRSRHRLKALLLRHGYRYHGKSAWTEAHMRYLRELVLPHPAMKVILEDYLMAISAAQERIQRCETAMIDRLSSLGVYGGDNTSAWDMQPDGHYVRRRPGADQPRRETQQLFIQLAAEALSSSSGEKAGHDQG
jgi:Transposase